MKILVTGGAGYIGSHCVKALLNDGFEVDVIDNLLTGHKSAVDPRAKLFIGDIRDDHFLNEFFAQEKVDGVIHFAANSLVGESMQNPLKYFDNNTYGTTVLLRAMILHNVKKIVFSSTAATYGEPKRVPIVETDDTIPTNPYGESKLMMEKMMKWCDVSNGLKYIALRYFNVAGAYYDGSIGEDHNPETHLIPLILQVPLGKRDHLTIYGNDYPTRDGTCIRDYVQIEDLISAHILALKRLLDGGESEVFNLGSEEGYSVLEMVKAVEEVTGKPVKVQMGARRAGDPAVLIASNKNAREVLGWNPKFTNIKDIISSAWKFHSLHPNGYQDK